MIKIPQAFKFITKVYTGLRFQFGESVLKLRREKESQLAQKIRTGLNASFVSVNDTTVGTSSCGQMYSITVESAIFEGKNKLQQQRLVNELMGEQLKAIHGYTLKTMVPKKTQPATVGEKKQNSETEPKKQ